MTNTGQHQQHPPLQMPHSAAAPANPQVAAPATPRGRRRSGPLTIVSAVFMAVAIVVSAYLGWNYAGTPSTPKSSSAGSASAGSNTNVVQAAPVVEWVEVLIPEPKHGCYTPCKVYIDWPFTITTWDPVTVKWPGVLDPVLYKANDGEFEAFHAPENMRSGEATFTSPDEKKQHVFVQVYRKVRVPKTW